MHMTMPMYHALAHATPLIAPRADSEAKGARGVISMSLGGSGPSNLLDDAVREAHEAGLVVVAAAGNDGTDGCTGALPPTHNFHTAPQPSCISCDQRAF